uniref:acetyl-CoA sensor PanZ family protein n=1 Tax=Pseudomonas aeruginosa TaxID=287 RepID=UPI00397C9969
MPVIVETLAQPSAQDRLDLAKIYADAPDWLFAPHADGAALVAAGLAAGELIAALAPFRRPLFTLGREPLEHLGQVPPHQHWTVRCLQGQPAAPRAEVI